MAVKSSDSHHCYIHDVSGNAQWWDKHASEVEHEYTGVGVCKDCRKSDIPFKYVGKLHNGALPPVYCEEHQ